MGQIIECILSCRERDRIGDIGIRRAGGDRIAIRRGAAGGIDGQAAVIIADRWCIGCRDSDLSISRCAEQQKQYKQDRSELFFHMVGLTN